VLTVEVARQAPVFAHLQELKLGLETANSVRTMVAMCDLSSLQQKIAATGKHTVTLDGRQIQLQVGVHLFFSMADLFRKKPLAGI